MSLISLKTCIDGLYGFSLVWNALIFIPQLIKIVKTHKVATISLLLYIAFNCGQALAVLEGIHYHDTVLTLGYIVALITSVPITVLIIYHRYYACHRARTLLFSLLGLSILATAYYALSFSGYSKEITDKVFGANLLLSASLLCLQAFKIHKKKSCEGLSLATFVGFCGIELLAVINGLYFYVPALIYGSSVSFFACLAVTLMILKYRSVQLRCAETAY